MIRIPRRSEFPKLNVICPSDAVAAVLKGAVMYGHNPELISERICPRTYGISVSAYFDVSDMGTVSTPRRLTSLSLIAYIGFSLDDSYTSTFATVSNALFGAHVNSKLLFPTRDLSE
jgi:hypothetical protein